MDARQGENQMQEVPSCPFGSRGDCLPRHAYAASDLVQNHVARLPAEKRLQRTGPSVFARLLLSDRVAVPPQAAQGHGPSRGEKLSGVVEVDEAYVGGKGEGRLGRGVFGKSIVLVASERKTSDQGRPVIGRARLLVIQDVTSGTLSDAVGELVENGATIVTDAWSGYAKLSEKGFTHVVSCPGRKNQSTPFDSECMIEEDSPLPNCHRVISLLKGWILGTLQGSVGKEHMQAYLNEFVFRFNRRSSKARGMLFWRLMQIAVGCEPTTRHSIIHPPHLAL